MLVLVLMLLLSKKNCVRVLDTAAIVVLDDEIVELTIFKSFCSKVRSLDEYFVDDDDNDGINLKEGKLQFEVVILFLITETRFV
mmetsp:Transcript_24012/g.27487  ORF Transcript_24012/g.27487 Transcript_24012/m.27487 type:complete len:84 (-) Transcript_24012:117-368(-)